VAEPRLRLEASLGRGVEAPEAQSIFWRRLASSCVQNFSRSNV